MNDPLAAFPRHRQPMVIRAVLCRNLAERIEIPGVTSAYRSSDDIRVVISELSKHLCFPPLRPINAGEPPTAFKNAARQRMYDRLVAEFGPMCASCGKCYGHVVDHDHFSGIVRGLLCRVCNTWVETCLHADSADCHYAEYLNAPPAVDLEMRYPAGHRRRALDEVRRAILRFDVLDRSTWPSADPTEWRWTVPEKADLDKVATAWRLRHPEVAQARAKSIVVTA